MIQEIKPKSLFSGNYGKYFLAAEAPGDEDQPPRRNMKLVTVKPDSRVRLDFTNDFSVEELPNETETLVDDPLPEVTADDGGDNLPEVDTGLGVGDDLPAVNEEPVEGQEPMQTPDLPTVEPPTDAEELPDVTEPEEPDVDVDIEDSLPDVNDDIQGQNVQVPPEPASGEPDFATGEEIPSSPDELPDPGTGDPDSGDTDDYTQVGDAPADPNADDTSSPDGGEPATGGEDDTDFTKVGDDADDSTSDTTQDSDADSTTGDENRGPGLEYDSVRKYNLYKEFARLRASLDTYIDKLESCISDDVTSNQIIKEATKRFHEIYDLITDYMIMKYELCNYVQNLLFYQKMVASIQMIFKLLKTTNTIYRKEAVKRK